jgi:hypothetical protein
MIVDVNIQEYASIVFHVTQTLMKVFHVLLHQIEYVLVVTFVVQELLKLLRALIKRIECVIIV